MDRRAEHFTGGYTSLVGFNEAMFLSQPNRKWDCMRETARGMDKSALSECISSMFPGHASLKVEERRMIRKAIMYSTVRQIDEND